MNQLLVRYKKLESVRSRLAAGPIPLSDALLRVIHLCRGAIPESRLRLLNRELLGYHPEEAHSFLPNGADAYGTNILSSAVGGQPIHRMLSGRWVPVGGALNKPGLFHLDICESRSFYADGMIELENILTRVTISESTWISVTSDAERNQVFMSTTSALMDVYNLARKELCSYIDSLLLDLLGTSGGDQVVEAKLILVPKQRF